MADTDLTQSEGIYESRRESDASQADLVKRWMAEIELIDGQEKNWRKDGQKSRDYYRSEGEADGQRFNIHFSNVQTAVTALYNSTPTPDVRTRYSDPDEVSRVSGQAIERVLSYSVDSYPFDDTIKASVQDMTLAGRGQSRVRYSPTEHDGQVYQEVSCEHVQWKHYRFGPCTEPSSRPWEAFTHFLTRDQLMQLSPEKGGGINLDFTLASDGRQGKTKADASPNVYKRAIVHEIWDKRTRKVYWIAPSHTAGPIRVDDDPYGLIGFYATPDPLYAIRTTDSTVPVCPLKQIFPLVEELEDVTVRIQALIRVCKWRGIRHPAIPSFELLEDATDGEMVAPVDGGELLMLVQSGGLDKFIWLMPIEQLVKTLQQLYVQREQIKQQIFEVSGLADIMRGQSDPNETLGAQEIKANFGTMRLQDAQKEVQRFCRDLFRLKAEIACNMFDSQNLAMMTGLNLPSRQEVMGAKQQLQQMQMMAQRPQLPPPGAGGQAQGAPAGAPMPAGPGQMVPQAAPAQPPPPPEPPAELVELANQVSWEDVLETLKSGVMRGYRIDIETDSTILGDVRQAQQQASAFLEGTAKFMASLGPMVEAGAMQMDVAIDLYSSIVRRSFRLGKQAEDALARWGAEAAKKAKNPEPPPPSPEEIKAKAEMEKMKGEMVMAKEKHGMEMQKFQAELQFKGQSQAMDLQGKKAEMEMDAQKAQMEFEADQMKTYADLAMEQERNRMEMVSDQNRAAIDEHMARVKAARDDEAMARDSYYGERKAQMSERMAAQKHQQQMDRARQQPTRH